MTVSNQETINQQENKPSLLWSIIKQLTLALFPGIRLLKINQGLKRVNKFYKHEWFDKQRKRNTLVSMAVSLPFLLCLLLAFVSIMNADPFWLYLGKAKGALFSMEISRFFELLGRAWTAGSGAESMSSRSKFIAIVLLVGLVITFILGTIVMITHPLIKESKKLYQMLQRNGVIDKNDSSRLVLATPLGFLIDITGNTAKEIKDSERIWMALNQRITDWAEDPNQRAICFFKKAYNLKNTYSYSFNLTKTK